MTPTTPGSKLGERDGSAHRGPSAPRRVDLRDERGVAFTEFALIAPVLLLIVAGLLSFGRVLFYWIEANHLANETTRWAVVDRNPYEATSTAGCTNEVTGGKTTLQEQAACSATGEFQGKVSVCIDLPPDDTPTTLLIGDPVRTQVVVPFDFIPFVGVGQIEIRGSATMRVERFAFGQAPSAWQPGSEDVGTC